MHISDSYHDGAVALLVYVAELSISFCMSAYQLLPDMSPALSVRTHRH
jgi:hypothetical protein